MHFDIPDEFLNGLPVIELLVTIDRGALDRGQCIRLWESLGRTDDPPSNLQVLTSIDELIERARHKINPNNYPG
jgi:hypothetical protein